MKQLKADFAIAIVTHNLQQAQRVSDDAGFLYVETSEAAGPATCEVRGFQPDIPRPQAQRNSAINQRRVQINRESAEA